MAGKTYDVSHEDLVNIVAEETKYSKKDIDETINAYEKSITTSFDQIKEKDPDFEKINVYSRVAAYVIDKETDSQYGDVYSMTPLIPKDMFDEISKTAMADVKMKEALNNVDKEKKSKAS